MAMMKACLATGEPRKLVCREITTPRAEPGWLLLETRFAGICGSDLEYLDGSFALMRQGTTQGGAGNPVMGIRPGSIPGHEFVAEVVEVGEGVRGWSPGDRAAPLGSPDPLGIGPPNPGYENYKCMAEYFLSTPQGVLKVPDEMPDKDAVFVEPLTTGYGAVAAAGVKPGQSVVVIGAGKIGILAALAARVTGASPVISVDLVDSRLAKAREMGVDLTVNPQKEDLIQTVADMTNGGPGSVLICVRDGKVLNQAAEMARNGASIVLAGFVTPMEVNPMLWTVKRLKVIGILGGSMQDSLYMIARKQIQPQPLISEVIPFDDCQRAIDSVYSGENIAVLMK